MSQTNEEKLVKRLDEIMEVYLQVLKKLPSPGMRDLQQAKAIGLNAIPSDKDIAHFLRFAKAHYDAQASEKAGHTQFFRDFMLKAMDHIEFLLSRWDMFWEKAKHWQPAPKPNYYRPKHDPDAEPVGHFKMSEMFADAVAGVQKNAEYYRKTPEEFAKNNQSRKPARRGNL